LELRQSYIDALCREMELRAKDHFNSVLSPDQETVSTIYLGGGTPSQLSFPQLQQLFIYINKVYSLDLHPEITIEVNPDDVTATFAAALTQLPVNRISMGVQTFNDQRLQFLHRRHTAGQVAVAVDRLRSAGIKNLSIDLMYGFPGESLSDWESDINAALALDAEHISAYCLMIEEGTELWKMMEKSTQTNDIFHQRNVRKWNENTEETERLMYDILIDRLTASGYEHYEISNFARPGFRSQHNSSYWNGTPYIGLGAAAHSYDIRSRSWNIADVKTYIEGIEHGERYFEEELLDDDTRYNDTITVGLRTKEGINLTKLSDKHRDYCTKNARRYLDDGLAEIVAQHLRLTRHGLFVSDMVMSDLMIV